MKDFSKYTREELIKCSLEALTSPELNNLLLALRRSSNYLSWIPMRCGRPLSAEEEKEKRLITEKINNVKSRISAIKWRS